MQSYVSGKELTRTEELVERLTMTLEMVTKNCEIRGASQTITSKIDIAPHLLLKAFQVILFLLMGHTVHWILKFVTVNDEGGSFA